MIISVSGGKGGTGKSTISTNLAVLLENFALVDLDVEAPNDYILLNEELGEGKPVRNFKPKFNHSVCTGCGECVKACNDGAIVMSRERKPVLLEELCSGCTACKLACPVKGAIEEDYRTVGFIYLNETKYGFPLVTGCMVEGEERTYKVVLETKGFALKRFENLIFDTAAGAGNSAFKSLEGSDLVVAVTEPTPFGARDLSKTLEITKHLKIPTVIVVNKDGIGDEKPILELSRKYGAPIIGRIPYSENVVKSYFYKKPVVTENVPEAEIFEEIRERILEELKCK